MNNQKKMKRGEKKEKKMCYRFSQNKKSSKNIG